MEQITMETVEAKLRDAVKEVNAILGKKPVDSAAYSTSMDNLVALEKQYGEMAANAFYDKFIGTENAVPDVIKAYAYKTFGHHESHDKTNANAVISVELVDKERQINLLAFCKRAKIDTEWAHSVSKLNQLLCLRAAKSLGIPAKDIATTYYLREAAQKIEMGGTPDSNTKVVKLLQGILDDILPEGCALTRCNTHDVAYLDDLYGKKSNKARLTVRVSNDTYLLRILVDVAYRLLTNGKYGIDGFRRVKK